MILDSQGLRREPASLPRLFQLSNRHWLLSEHWDNLFLVYALSILLQVHACAKTLTHYSERPSYVTWLRVHPSTLMSHFNFASHTNKRGGFERDYYRSRRYVDYPGIDHSLKFSVSLYILLLWYLHRESVSNSFVTVTKFPFSSIDPIVRLSVLPLIRGPCIKYC